MLPDHRIIAGIMKSSCIDEQEAGTSCSYVALQEFYSRCLSGNEKIQCGGRASGEEKAECKGAQMSIFSSQGNVATGQKFFLIFFFTLPISINKRPCMAHYTAGRFTDI